MWDFSITSKDCPSSHFPLPTSHFPYECPLLIIFQFILGAIYNVLKTSHLQNGKAGFFLLRPRRQINDL